MNTSIKLSLRLMVLPYRSCNDNSILCCFIVSISLIQFGKTQPFFKTLECQLQFIWHIVQAVEKVTRQIPGKGYGSSKAPTRRKKTALLPSALVCYTRTLIDVGEGAFMVFVLFFFFHTGSGYYAQSLYKIRYFVLKIFSCL